MSHSVFVDGVMFTDPTKEQLMSALPERPEEEINLILMEYISDSDAAKVDYDMLEAWKEQQRSAVNSWRDDQFKAPVIFNYSDRPFKATLDYIGILKSYQDYLPEGAIWTDENDSDMILSQEDIAGLISAMQESLSETFSDIHRNARARKNIINQCTSIPDSTGH